MPRPRFSLRTLLLLVLLIASGFGLWWRWAPWVQVARFDNLPSTGSPSTPVLIQSEGIRYRIIDPRTLKTSERFMSTIPENEVDFVLGGHSSVAIVEDDGAIELIDTRNGAVTVLPDFSSASEAAFSADETRLLIKRPLTVYDLVNRKVLLRCDTHPIRDCYLNDDELYVLQARRAAQYRAVLDCTTFADFHSALNDVLHVVGWWSPDGTILATAVNGQAVQLWDTKTGTKIKNLVFKGELDSYPECAISPDNRRLAVSTGTTKIYEIASASELFDIAGTLITANVPSDNAGRFWLTTLSGHDLLWDIETKQCLGSFNAGYDLCISPDGARVASVPSAELDLWVYGTKSRRHLATLRAPDGCPYNCGTFYGDVLIAKYAYGGTVYVRRRDEGLSGVLQLPECWLTVIFASALLFSLRADYRSLRRQQPPPPASVSAAKEAA